MTINRSPEERQIRSSRYPRDSFLCLYIRKYLDARQRSSPVVTVFKFFSRSFFFTFFSFFVILKNLLVSPRKSGALPRGLWQVAGFQKNCLKSLIRLIVYIKWDWMSLFVYLPGQWTEIDQAMNPFTNFAMKTTIIPVSGIIDYKEKMIFLRSFTCS